jgi:hypothetical protein
LGHAEETDYEAGQAANWSLGVIILLVFIFVLVVLVAWKILGGN